MGTKSLVALDTDHIKQYVFGTDKLKEIRGASSLLDYLNRIVMRELAWSDGFNEKCIIYANGGSGLFLIDTERAEDYGKLVRRTFGHVTGGTGSVTYAVQELPEDAPTDIDSLLKYPLANTLALMRYRLRRKKDSPLNIITLSSHPFIHLCDACGIEYASPESEEKKSEVDRELDEENKLYCISCQNKRQRDSNVRKTFIPSIEAGRHTSDDEYLWDRLIEGLHAENYNIPPQTERPHDFNVFRNFKGAKDYLGLIYADANGMGKKVEECETLGELHQFAQKIDGAIYKAVCFAIARHLKIEDYLKIKDDLANIPEHPLFPFDILLLGGDDVVMVVPASAALQVANSIAQQFYVEANKQDEEQARKAARGEASEEEGQKYSLSVGVVLAPVKYPFGMLQDLAESTLKAAKKEGAKRRGQSKYGDTFINFMTVTGSTSHDFKKVYKSLHSRRMQVNGRTSKPAFYATLRPYTVEELGILLDTIREGKKKALGRTKLHQVREAIMKMNLTTSVEEGMEVLRNWRTRQREFVMQHVYTLGGRYQAQYSNPDEPGSLFPRVTFPWFADGPDTYRTSLLDFVELYDFVTQEGVDDEDEN